MYMYIHKYKFGYIMFRRLILGVPDAICGGPICTCVCISISLVTLCSSGDYWCGERSRRGDCRQHRLYDLRQIQRVS